MNCIVDNMRSDETYNGTWNAGQENFESFNPYADLSLSGFDTKNGASLDCDLAEYLSPDYWPSYQETPPSSTGTTSNGDSNNFDSSFEKSVDQMDLLPSIPPGDSLLGCPRSAYEAAFSNSQFVAQSPNTCFVSLAAVQGSSPPYFQNESETLESIPNVASPNQFAGKQRRSAWGSPTQPQIWPMGPTPAKRRTSKPHGMSLKNAARFRTARRRTSISSSSDSFDDVPKTSRSTHNQIEKQYRNRLNSQFESLLSVIPQNIERDRRELGDGAEHRVSKSEVLIMAQKRIRELERQDAHLEKENRTLEENAARMKDLWIQSGGVALP